MKIDSSPTPGARPAWVPHRRSGAAVRTPPAWPVVVLLLVFGVGLWPLSEPSWAAQVDPTAPTDTGVSAPHPPVLHAGSGTMHAAVGALPDPAPPAGTVRSIRSADAVGSAATDDVPARRTRAQRIYGRRNLEGG